VKAIRRAINGANINRLRFWIQLVALVLLVYGGYVGIELGNSLPVLSCGYNPQGHAGLCFLLPLQHNLSGALFRLFRIAAGGFLIAVLWFLLWFVVLNKAWCGFICPLGTLQDWLTALRRRFHVRNARFTLAQFRALTRIKYVLLALAILLPLGVGAGWLHRDLNAPFCAICPGKTIVPLLNGNAQYFAIDFSSSVSIMLSTLCMVTTGLFFAGSFGRKRFWCFLCPMSALHYLLSKAALLRLRKDGAKCTRCGDCYRVCDMEIAGIADDVVARDIMRDDCMLCLKCVAACPEDGALKATFAGATLYEATSDGFVRRMDKGGRK
jgi:polyferredoxin